MRVGTALPLEWRSGPKSFEAQKRAASSRCLSGCGAGGARHRDCLSWPTVLWSTALALTIGVVLVARLMDRRLATKLPDVPPISVMDVFADQTPISVTITGDWQKVRVTVATDALRSDVTLWRKMNFDDWDTVSESTAGEPFSDWRVPAQSISH